MTRPTRLLFMWDWLIRRKTPLALARKYGLTVRQAEQAIRESSARMRKTGYP